MKNTPLLYVVIAGEAFVYEVEAGVSSYSTRLWD